MYLKEIVKQIPGVVPLYLKLQKIRLSLKSTEQVFTHIHHKNIWGDQSSVSGPGSNNVQTQVVKTELPRVLNTFGCKSMLDIPCGDFYWMKDVSLPGIQYIGADIVAGLIDQNSEFVSPVRTFCKLDLIKDPLPSVDLIFCRDCLVHLSFSDIFEALSNICESDSTYLLTTTFTDRLNNRDIVTGDWRPLNFELAPFFFPPPIQLINENCTEGGDIYKDKSLGLWKVSDIAACWHDGHIRKI